MATLSCQAAGGRRQDADPVALSVELLHTFSLVHDDLMDEDAVRRGVDAVHEAYGSPDAILAGDVLFSTAFEALADLGERPGSMAIVRDVARTARRLCEGQHLDMAFEHRWPSVDAYEAMIDKKTAALFACAAGNGARVADPSQDTVDAFTSFGRSLGLGFQVQDDVLDLVGDEETLGKPVGSDVRSGKKTHPVLEAHERADAEQQRRLEDVLEGSADDDGVAFVRALLDETGALAASRERALALFDDARQRLIELEESPARESLVSLVDWTRDRER